MSRWSVVGLAVAAVMVVLGLLAVLIAARRHRPASDPTGRDPAVDTGAGLVGVLGDEATRRVVVQRGIIVVFAAALAGVVASALDYVWPSVTSSTGGRFKLGSPGQVRRRIAQGNKPVYDLTGRFFVVEYPSADLSTARRAYAGPQVDAMELGLVALSQKCPHLGCAVRWCASSGWFECPCHGSRYNPVGELERGPAPRGLDRHGLTVVDGVVVVDTATLYLGPPPGTVTTDQPAKGPHCY